MTEAPYCLDLARAEPGGATVYIEGLPDELRISDRAEQTEPWFTRDGDLLYINGINAQAVYRFVGDFQATLRGPDGYGQYLVNRYVFESWELNPMYRGSI